MNIDLDYEQKEAIIAGAKVSGIWAFIGITDWSQTASMLAAFLTLLFILEFIWKKVIRPFAEWRGWLIHKRRLIITSETDLGDI